MTDAALTLADGRRVPYQIVISPRSRAVRLRLSAKNGLVITVPRGFDQSQLATILDAKRDWVARHLARIEAIHSPTLVSTAPPVELKLLAVAESWQIAYRATSAKTISARTAGSNQITVTGQVEQIEACHAVLRRWLARRGQDTLVPWLARLSEETGLRYVGVSIKGQRSRWGSCSAQGRINLNYKLLFLPSKWVRYVLIHELCHTVELNHSPRFWDWVRRFEPEATQLSAAVRQAREYVPAWV